jgi:streptomycin 6-kinase
MAEVTELERRFDEVFGPQEAYQPAKFEPIEQPQVALVRFVEAAKLAKQVIEKAGFEITIQGTQIHHGTGLECPRFDVRVDS